MGETGSLGLALTARGSSGTLYRLRQATFDVFRLGDAAGTPIPLPPVDLPPSSGGPIIGTGGTGGGTGVGGLGGFAGSVAAGGAGGGVVIPPSPGDFFDTTLSSESDPLSSTL